MRQICYDLCLYKLNIRQESIFELINALKNKLVDSFKITPSGFSDLSQRKIKKYTEVSFIKLKDKPEIEGVTIYFGGELGVNDEWVMYLAFYQNTLTLILDESFFRRDEKLLLKLSQEISKIYGYDFGFIQHFPFKQKPECYNHGTIGNDWSEIDEEKIWSWSMNYNRPDGQYKPGDLRDIYPYNIISDLHLNRDVHGQTLESWIKSDQTHGTLEKISDTHWLWSIDDQHIPHAQEVLSSANLLVAYWEKY
jgi:hypothetical protein